MTFIAGEVDERALRIVQAEYEAEQDSFVDYLTIAELSRIAHLSRARIRHAVTHARLRPMTGIKRGPLWFIRRTEALRWAHTISEYEMTRWTKNAKRLGRMIRKEERGDMPRYDTDLAPRPPYTYEPPPDGTRVYTISEVAALLDVAPATVRIYLAPSQVLRSARRYRLADRTFVINAEDVDAHKTRMATKRPDDRRLRKNRPLSVVKQEVA